MDNDTYIYTLERALTRLLDLFEPTTGGDTKYNLYDDDGDPIIIDSTELDDALDYANTIMDGDEYSDE